MGAFSGCTSSRPWTTAAIRKAGCYLMLSGSPGWGAWSGRFRSMSCRSSSTFWKATWAWFGPVRCCQNASPFTTNNSHAGMKFARHHRMGAGKWKELHQLEVEIWNGCVVYRKYVFHAGCENFVFNLYESFKTWRDQCFRFGKRSTIHGQWGLTTFWNEKNRYLRSRWLWQGGGLHS